MTGYIVDNSRRVTLPEAIPGEVYDVEMVAPGHYVAKRQGDNRRPRSGRAAIEGLEDPAPDEPAGL